MNIQKLTLSILVISALLLILIFSLFSSPDKYVSVAHAQLQGGGTHDGTVSDGFSACGNISGNPGGPAGTVGNSGDGPSDTGGGVNSSCVPLYSCTWGREGNCDSSTIICSTNAVCAATHNNCAVGSYGAGSATENASGWSWACNSPDGGMNVACFEAKPAVNGACGATHNSCSAGNSSGASESGTQWLWSCAGINGGGTASCAENKPTPPPTPVTADFTANGSTDLTVNVGTVMNYVWSSTNGTSWASDYTTSASCPGGPGPSVWPPAHGSAAGSDNSSSISAAQAGCVYTMNYTASNPTESKTATVVVRVNAVVPQCADGVDNSDPEDTLVDYPNDPGCTSLTDDDETDTTSPPTPPPSLQSCSGTELLGCQLDPTPHGGTDGACNPTTYSGVCSYTCDDSVWGSPSNNSCVPLTPSGSNLPELTAPKTVKIGDEVDLTWDTNNNDETLCSLTGGTVSLSGNQMNNGTGDSETGVIEVIVNGRTTYTLTCPAGISVQTIEVIPASWES